MISVVNSIAVDQDKAQFLFKACMSCMIKIGTIRTRSNCVNFSISCDDSRGKNLDAKHYKKKDVFCILLLHKQSVCMLSSCSTCMC